jgi:uncharacterized OB-fold protein
MNAKTRVAAIEGWYTLEDPPHLIGSRCNSCGSYFFPRLSSYCRNPACDGTTFRRSSSAARPHLVLHQCLLSAPPPFVAPNPSCRL